MLIGRIGAVPLALGDVSECPAAAALDRGVGLVEGTLHCGGAGIAKNLIEAHQAIVVGGHDGYVPRRPRVHVTVRPDTGHAVAAEPAHIPVGKHGQLAIHNRVPKLVLWSLTAVDVEKRDRFMQVMHDGRMPIQIPLQKALVCHAGIVDVAVVIVLGVLPPIGYPGHLLVVGYVDVVGEVPVNGAIASIGIGHRHDGDDDVGANLLNERRVFRRQPIGQFHQHFRGPQFGTVQAS